LIVTPNSDEWVNFDPHDNSLFVDGRWDAVFARLRESGTVPVYDDGAVPIYSLVRYTDIVRAYKEPDVFSPSAGLTLDAFDPTAWESPSKMLEMAEPNRHRALREAMLGAFRGKSVANLAVRTRNTLDQFLLSANGGEVVDFVDAFAKKAASATTSALLGAEPEETSRLDPVLGALGQLNVDMSSRSSGQRQKVELWLLRELTRVVRAHRQRGRSNGLIGMLRTAEVDGQPLTEQEVVLNCLNVVVAGTGAMQHTFAGAIAVWAEHTVDLDGLAAEPELTRCLIDETLRWLTPVVHLTRVVTEDVEISGQRVPEGSGICLWNISANRDEEIFDDPTAFRPDRPPGRHLAFGAGPQHCLGAQLIRAQLGHLLTGMLENGVRFELDGQPRWIRSNTITGVEALPVRIRRERGAGSRAAIRSGET
jgi:cytochrome P450